MKYAAVLLAACGGSPPPVSASVAPQTLVYRMLDLRRGVELATVTLAIGTTVTYEVVAETGEAVTGGFDHFQRTRDATIRGTARHDDGTLVLDFEAAGRSIVLACIEKPFVIAPATATAHAGTCDPPAWNEPTEQITLLECRERSTGDVVGAPRIALAAPAPGVEEVKLARAGCPPLDPETRPLLRHATAGRVAPLFVDGT